MKQTILITGGTDGIGLALARFYLGKGQRPLLLGRRTWQELPHLAADFSPDDYCRADLSRPDCVSRVTEFLTKRGINRLDVIIHNAGVGFYGRCETQPSTSINELIDINLVAPVALTQALLPWLTVSKGQVVFISSVMADLPAPDYAVYVATKAALDSFARSLHQEWRGRVIVQAIHPGATRTGMHSKMGMSLESIYWEQFPSPEKVAAQIGRDIEGKRPFTTIGLKNGLLGMAGRRAGWLIDARMRDQQTVEVAAQIRSDTTPLCVITGAADGIGKALARRFGQAGYAVVGVDVDETRSSETERELAGEGIDISFVVADLSDDVGVETAVSALNTGRPIDILIHNAGISAVGHFSALAMARQQKVIDLNLRAPLLMTARLLENQAATANTSFVFLSSLSTYMSYPGAAVYAATKAGLAAYARSLRVAMGPQGHVLSVFPGPTRTVHARRYSPDNGREASRMLPEDLAEAIFTATEKRQSKLIPGVGNQIFATMGQIAPNLMDRAMQKMILDKLDGQILGD